MMSLQTQIMKGYISTTNNAESWIDICKGFCEMLDIEMLYPEDLSSVVLIPNSADSILPSPVNFDTNISILVVEFLRKLLYKKTEDRQAMVPVFQIDGERLYQVFALDRPEQKEVIALLYKNDHFWLDCNGDLAQSQNSNSLLQLVRGTAIGLGRTAYPKELLRVITDELVSLAHKGKPV